MLLEEGKNVVYLIREPDKKGMYYEIIPTGGQYQVKAYRESTGDDIRA
jgi:hypothetical protein